MENGQEEGEKSDIYEEYILQFRPSCCHKDKKFAAAKTEENSILKHQR